MIYNVDCFILKGSPQGRLITDTITKDAEKISVVDKTNYKLIYHNVLKRFLRVVLIDGVATLDVSEISGLNINPNWEWERFIFTDVGSSIVTIKNQTFGKYLSMDSNGVLGLVNTVNDDTKFIVHNTHGLFSATHGRYVTMEKRSAGSRSTSQLHAEFFVLNGYFNDTTLHDMEQQAKNMFPEAVAQSHAVGLGLLVGFESGWD